MDPRMYIGTVTVYRCLFENCDRQMSNVKELEKHIECDHFNNSQPPIQQPVQSQPRGILQPLDLNVPQTTPIVVPYEDTVVRLGGGFTAVPAADMTDSAKAKRYMRFLRVPGYELCQLCTLGPCILHEIEERDVECMPECPSEPSEDNHRARKLLYKQAWATLDNLGFFGLKVTLSPCELLLFTIYIRIIGELYSALRLNNY